LQVAEPDHSDASTDVVDSGPVDTPARGATSRIENASASDAGKRSIGHGRLERD